MYNISQSRYLINVIYFQCYSMLIVINIDCVIFKMVWHASKFYLIDNLETTILCTSKLYNYETKRTNDELNSEVSPESLFRTLLVALSQHGLALRDLSLNLR